MDDDSAAVQQPEASSEPAPSEAPAPILDEIGAWFERWYPESPPADHPAPYLSGPWHHARAAFEDLKARLGR